MAITDGLISGALGFLGAQSTNEANKDIAASNNEWSAFQYASRYQTMTEDMKKAGLNPMLAYSQSPGAAPSAQQVTFQNPMASATEAYHKSNERDVMAAQIANVSADTALKGAQAKLAAEQTLATQADERLKTATANEATVRMTSQMNYGNPTQKALAASYWSQIQVNKATLPKIASEIVLNGANAGLAKARIAEAVANGEIAQADVQRALNAKRFEESAAGKAKPFTDYGLSSAQRAADVVRGGQQININAQPNPKPLGSGKISQRWKR
jgi:hypothetical protein